MVAGAAGWAWTRPTPAPVVTRYSLLLRPNESLRPSAIAGNIAISPDGNRMGYVGAADGGTRLWLREHDKLRPTPIAGTENGVSPFFSPDGNQVGYILNGRTLRIAPLNGGPPVNLTDSLNASGGEWGTDGYIYTELQEGSGGGQIWVKQLRTGAFSRVSGELDDADRPVWTPDGRYVGFLATRNTHRTAWIRRADGSDSARAVAGSSAEYDEVWFDQSGRFTLLRSEGSAEGTRHLLVLEKGVDSVPRMLLQSRYDNFAMILSPDGRWLAYVSDESGSAEVYVRPFPNVDSAKFSISVGGGMEPLWRRDGTELFFRNTRGEMYSVPFGPGREVEHGAPHLLFTRPGMALQEFYRSYDVHPDGKRFLMLSSGDASTTRLSVIFNWRPEVQQTRGSGP